MRRPDPKPKERVTFLEYVEIYFFIVIIFSFPLCLIYLCVVFFEKFFPFIKSGDVFVFLFAIIFSTIARVFGDYTVNRLFRRAEGPSRRMLRHCLAWDGFTSKAQIERELERLGPRAGLIDLGPNLAWLGRVLVRKKGEGGKALFQWLSRRNVNPDTYAVPVWEELQSSCLTLDRLKEQVLRAAKEDPAKRVSDRDYGLIASSPYDQRISEFAFAKIKNFDESSLEQIHKYFISDLGKYYFLIFPQFEPRGSWELPRMDEKRDKYFYREGEEEDYNSFMGNVKNKNNRWYEMDLKYLLNIMGNFYGRDAKGEFETIFNQEMKFWATCVYFKLATPKAWDGRLRDQRPLPLTGRWEWFKRFFTYGFTHGGTLPLAARNRAAELLMGRDLSWIRTHSDFKSDRRTA